MGLCWVRYDGTTGGGGISGKKAEWRHQGHQRGHWQQQQQ